MTIPNFQLTPLSVPSLSYYIVPGETETKPPNDVVSKILETVNGNVTKHILQILSPMQQPVNLTREEKPTYYQQVPSLYPSPPSSPDYCSDYDQPLDLSMKKPLLEPEDLSQTSSIDVEAALTEEQKQQLTSAQMNAVMGLLSMEKILTRQNQIVVNSCKDDEEDSLDDDHKLVIDEDGESICNLIPKIEIKIEGGDSLDLETDEKYVCGHCDKIFSKHSSLARHKYEHSGKPNL